MFTAIVTDKDESGYRSELRELSEQDLPEGDVTVRVAYSTLNYKDGLAITGKGPVVRRFPMVPGIDLAGVVESSDHPSYSPGDRVVLNGWGVGETHWGGLAQLARLQGDWLVPLPDGLSEQQAMAIGTAGYTAMLCLMALERHGITPGDGDVLVTGANGGVGSFAISLLRRHGYSVIAATGRPEEGDYLRQLGATSILGRAELSEPGRPLAKERWVAAIDSLGSHTLANVCAGTRAEGAVAACGMAQGMDLPATVAPFILRGVSLLGINSVTQPYDARVMAWQRLSRELDRAHLEEISHDIGLSEAIATAHELLAGRVRGRGGWRRCGGNRVITPLYHPAASGAARTSWRPGRFGSRRYWRPSCSAEVHAELPRDRRATFKRASGLTLAKAHSVEPPGPERGWTSADSRGDPSTRQITGRPPRARPMRRSGCRAATRRAGCVISGLQGCLLCFVTIAAGVVAEADGDASLRYVLAQALEALERLARLVSGRSSGRARPEAAGGGDGGAGDRDRADGGKSGRPRGPGGGPGGETPRIWPGSRWSGTSPRGTAVRSAGCRSRRWAIASLGSWTGRCSCGRSRVAAAGAGGPASAGCPPR